MTCSAKARSFARARTATGSIASWISSLEAAHHVAGTLGSPDVQRDLPSGHSQPASQEKIRNLNDMVRMQVRQEQPTDRTYRDTGLREANGRTPPAVKKESLAACFHKRACPELLQVDDGTHTGSEQHDPDASRRHCLGPSTTPRQC